MNNTLTDLNNILFAQLERLNDEDLSIEELEKEGCRAKILNDTAFNVIRNADLAFRVIQYQHLCDFNGEKLPKMLNVNRDSEGKVTQ